MQAADSQPVMAYIAEDGMALANLLCGPGILTLEPGKYPQAIEIKRDMESIAMLLNEGQGFLIGFSGLSVVTLPEKNISKTAKRHANRRKVFNSAERRQTFRVERDRLSVVIACERQV